MKKKPKFDLYSIGHSNHSPAKFIALLRQSGVNAIADVRSSPFSRHFPHFSQRELKLWLKYEGVSYVFLGKELGGRPSNPTLFCNGIADYLAMASTQLFAEGIERLIVGAENHQIAIMCSEHDPLDCHRCLLVARRLAERGLAVGHILSSGQISSHEQIEEQLLEIEGLGFSDLFATRAVRLAAAYAQRNLKVAYSENILSASVG